MSFPYATVFSLNTTPSGTRGRFALFPNATVTGTEQSNVIVLLAQTVSMVGTFEFAEKSGWTALPVLNGVYAFTKDEAAQNPTTPEVFLKNVFFNPELLDIEQKFDVSVLLVNNTLIEQGSQQLNSAVLDVTGIGSVFGVTYCTDSAVFNYKYNYGTSQWAITPVIPTSYNMSPYRVMDVENQVGEKRTVFAAVFDGRHEVYVRDINQGTYQVSPITNRYTLGTIRFIPISATEVGGVGVVASDSSLEIFKFNPFLTSNFVVTFQVLPGAGGRAEVVDNPVTTIYTNNTSRAYRVDWDNMAGVTGEVAKIGSTLYNFPFYSINDNSIYAFDNSLSVGAFYSQPLDLSSFFSKGVDNIDAVAMNRIISPPFSQLAYAAVDSSGTSVGFSPICQNMAYPRLTIPEVQEMGVFISASSSYTGVFGTSTGKVFSWGGYRSDFAKYTIPAPTPVTPTPVTPTPVTITVPTTEKGDSEVPVWVWILVGVGLVLAIAVVLGGVLGAKAAQKRKSKN